LRKAEWVDLRVCLGISNCFELDWAAVIDRLNDSPALRNSLDDPLDIAAADDHRHDVENSLIRLHLCRQPCKRVSIALDLECGERAINDCDIGSRRTLANTQLVQNESFRIIGMLFV